MAAASPSTVQTEVTILNQLGMHARPAMAFVDAANRFSSDIRVHKGDQNVDGKSIMQMTMLEATKGTQLTIVAQGSDAEDAIAVLKQLVGRKFDEE